MSISKNTKWRRIGRAFLEDPFGLGGNDQETKTASFLLFLFVVVLFLTVLVALNH